MKQEHTYTTRIVWTGDRGEGTTHYHSYDRTWNIAIPGKPVIECSNDPLLGGDPSRPNPEDLLISALSACHMLWYLHLASQAEMIVRGYTDQPVAIGETEPDGAGRFLKATLRPHIIVAPGTNLKTADELHPQIHQFCYIARSVCFPIEYQATYSEQEL